MESFKNSSGFVGESGSVNGQCRWPCYHADLSDLSSHKKYRDVPIKKSFKEKMIETRFARKEGRIQVSKDATKIAETELITLANRLYDDLSAEVFEKKTVEVIELTRNVCDLKSFAEQLDEQGSVLFGTLSEDLFLKSAKQITQSMRKSQMTY